ncbi:MAG: hypothetical protein ACOCY0_02255 [Roseicyclus sp.]
MRNSVRDILYRAGAEGAAPSATRSYANPLQGMAVVLGLLEDGVLPRRVTLAFDDGAEVTLDLAERQVLELVAATGSAAATRLPPGPLTLDDAQALAELLSAACRGAGAVGVTWRIAAGIDPAAGGVSLEALRRAAGVPTRARPAPGEVTWLDALVDHAEVDVRSAVLIDVDEAHVILGSQAEAEALADWAVEMLDVFLADSFPLAHELETKGAVTFGPQQNGAHILLAGLRGQFLLALVSGPDTSATLAAWQRIAATEIDGFLPAA